MNFAHSYIFGRKLLSKIYIIMIKWIDAGVEGGRLL